MRVLSLFPLVAGVGLSSVASCRAVLDLEPGHLVDAAVTDSGPDSGPDAAVPGKRRIALVQASPDAPGLFGCAATFPDAKTFEGGGLPELVVGPFGPPSGLAFGGTEVFDAPTELADALATKPVLFYFISGALGCKAQLVDIRGQTKRRTLVSAGRVQAGSTLAIIGMGCSGAARPNGECGAGSNYEVRPFDVSAADPGAGRFSLQVLNASLYTGSGSGPPSFNNIDLYLHAFKDATPTGGALEVSKDGVLYGGVKPDVPRSLSPAAAGEQLFLVVAPHGGTPCPAGPGVTPACPSVTLPLQPPTNDPSAAVVPGHALFVVLTGSPVGMGGPPTVRAILVGGR